MKLYRCLGFSILALFSSNRENIQHTTPSFAGSTVSPTAGLAPTGNRQRERGGATHHNKVEANGYTFGFEALATAFLRCVENLSQ
jgi:hypothetical protein